MASTTLPEPRLVNCQQVHGLHVTPARIVYSPVGISDGDPDRALRDAIASKADGLLITDVRTGEQWYVDAKAVAWFNFEAQLRFARMVEDHHRAEGHVFCWCGNWVHPDDLYEGTCGGRDCLLSEAQDRAGLVP